MDSHIRGTYDHVRCGCCGKPLEEHTKECFRHKFLEQAIANRTIAIFIEKSEKQEKSNESAYRMLEIFRKSC